MPHPCQQPAALTPRWGQGLHPTPQSWKETLSRRIRELLPGEAGPGWGWGVLASRQRGPQGGVMLPHLMVEASTV